VRALLRAGERVAKAQARALEGGRAEAVRAASAAERDALRPLVSSARELLEASRGSAQQSTLDSVAQTLRVAAVDPDGRELLERGVLTRELEVSGFSTLEGLMP
jgi:hypothetical protein